MRLGFSCFLVGRSFESALSALEESSVRSCGVITMLSLCTVEKFLYVTYLTDTSRRWKSGGDGFQNVLLMIVCLLFQ